MSFQLDKIPSLAMRISPRSVRARDQTLAEPFGGDSDIPPSSPLSPSLCMNRIRQPAGTSAAQSPSLLSRLDKPAGPMATTFVSSISLLDRISKLITNDDVEPIAAGDPLDIVLEDGLPIVPMADLSSPSHTVHPTAERVLSVEIPQDSEMPVADTCTGDVPSQVLTLATQHDPVDATMRASPSEHIYLSPGSEEAVDSLLKFTGSDGEMYPDVDNDSASLSVPISPRTELGDHPPPLPKSSSSVFDQCRSVLLPLVLQNAKLGDEFRGTQSADEICAQMTDERCAELMEKAKEVQEQLAIRNVAGQDRKDDLASGSNGVVRGREKHGNEGDAWTTALTGNHSNGPFNAESSYQNDGKVVPVSSFSPAPLATSFSAPTAPKAMMGIEKARTAEIPMSKRKPFATPMQEHPAGGKRRKSQNQGWSHRDRDSSQNRDMDKLPIPPEHSQPLSWSPPPPYAVRAEQTQVGPNPLDPQLFMSSRRKPPRRGSIDDVSSVRSPNNDSTTFAPIKNMPDITHSKSFSHSVPDQHTSLHQNEATYRDPPASPRLPIPGLWFAKVGLPQADIIDITFEIEPALGLFDNNIKVDSTHKTVALHVLCLPINAVSSTCRAFDHATTPETVASAMWAIKTHWPRGGKLIVEVNRGQTFGRSWLPIDLDLVGPAVDVTDHLRARTNTIRFIQLADLSEYVFVVHASKVSEIPLDVAVSRQPKDPAVSGTLDESERTSSIKLDGLLTHMSMKLKEKTKS